MTTTVPLGLLFSRSGSYARLSAEARQGALDAVAAVNADPAGRTELYAPLAASLLRGGARRHVVGCIS